MSDGPHRTLPMPPAWRRFAGRAANHSFSAQEVSEFLCPALASDWQSEIRKSLFDAVICAVDEVTQPSLFGNGIDEISRLRVLCDSPFSAAFCDAARDVLLDGLTGTVAIEQAIRASLIDRALCQIKAVEEHYMRKSNTVRASGVRLRLEQAVESASLNSLVGAISGGLSVAKRFEPRVRDALEDGPDLCVL